MLGGVLVAIANIRHRHSNVAIQIVGSLCSEMTRTANITNNGAVTAGKWHPNSQVNNAA